MNDFQNISGSWKGTLTYVGYSTGKPYSMPADIVVKRIGKTDKFTFSNIYPEETNANSIDMLTISTDGKYIDKELITSRKKLPAGEIEIITEEKGLDRNDNKPATFRHTYTLGMTLFKKRKEVQFVGESIWLTRHEYSYSKMLSR